MWVDALRFLSLGDATVRFVLFGAVMLAGATGLLGCFTFLRKRSLVGDAVAHASLPGICLAYLVSESKEPHVLLLGAILTGWIGAICIDLIRAHSPLKEDTAIAIVLTVFFGAGICLLTFIQGAGGAGQAGLDKFLFGQAASLVAKDLWALGILSLVLCGAVALTYKEFKILSFDPDFARAVGLRVHAYEVLLTTLLVAAIAIGLRMVGVVLMAALLITPAAAARQWTDRLPMMLLLAGGFGSAAGAVGAFASSLAPHMPTGPWIVVTVTLIFTVSLLFAPRRGVLARALRAFRGRTVVASENLITTLYRLGEHARDFGRAWPLESILRYRRLASPRALRILARLEKQGFVRGEKDHWILTGTGFRMAERIIRRHRLWELYLTEQVNLPVEKVHQDAEEVEHWLTQAQEDELEAILASPTIDPHTHPIPPPAPSHKGEAA